MHEKHVVHALFLLLHSVLNVHQACSRLSLALNSTAVAHCTPENILTAAMYVPFEIKLNSSYGVIGSYVPHHVNTE